jgi:hypothetical protein
VKFNTREVKPDKYAANQEKATLLQEKGDLNITLKFNKPTFLINTDSLLFAIDTLNVIPLATGTLTWNHMTNELRIYKKIDPTLLKTPITTPGQKPASKPKLDKTAPPVPTAGTPAKPAAKPKPVIKNQLIIAKGTFISIDQDTMPEVRKNIPLTPTEDLGIILAEVKTSAEHFIVQLLDKDFKPVQEISDTKKIRWEDIAPGDYRIRLVIDLNNNKKWDAGNYLKKEEPEPVFFYLNPKSTPPNITHVKANWEVGPLLITSE